MLAGAFVHFLKAGRYSLAFLSSPKTQHLNMCIPWFGHARAQAQFQMRVAKGTCQTHVSIVSCGRSRDYERHPVCRNISPRNILRRSLTAEVDASAYPQRLDPLELSAFFSLRHCPCLRAAKARGVPLTPGTSIYSHRQSHRNTTLLAVDRQGGQGRTGKMRVHIIIVKVVRQLRARLGADQYS